MSATSNNQINQTIEGLLRPVVFSELINKFHGGEVGYRSVAVDVTFASDGVKFEWRIYAGGSFVGGCQYGATVEEVIYKIEGFDPEEAKRREVVELKKRLALLEAPAATEGVAA